MNADLTVCISRRSTDEIVISITDEASRTRFVDARMTAQDFAYAITGQGFMPAKGELRGLSHVGKNKVYEQRQIDCPLTTTDRDVLEQWLIANAQEDGWQLDHALRSQSSIGRRDGVNVLNYGVFKYVEPEGV